MTDPARFAPGPSFDALPLPGLMLDADGRLVGVNDAAELWLNLSRRTALGHQLDDDVIQSRLRITPEICPLVERVRDGHATSLGAASGIVAGLVGIPPAAGSVSPLGGLVIGSILDGIFD